MRVMWATGSQGFTLLELLVVLTIMVLIASAWSFSAPRLFPRQQLRDEAQHLASALRASRSLARVTGTIQTIEIAGSGTSYRAAGETHDLPRQFSLRRVVSDTLGPAPALAFYPDGSSNGGRIEIRLDDYSAAVSAGPMMGRLEITE